MKKKYLLTAIVLWILVAAAIVVVYIFCINGGFNTNAMVKDETISLNNVHTIVVNTSYQKIEILKTNSDSMKVTQYSNSKERNKNLFIVSSNNDSINVSFDNIQKHNVFINIFNFNINDKLIIEIPESFTGNLEVKTSSGSIKVNDILTLKNIVMQSSSGSIRINHKLTADNLNVNTSSGGIYFGIVNVKAYYLHSTSGNISSAGISGGGEVKTSSGGIKLSLVDPQDNVMLNSTSGRINITLESSLEFTMNAQTTSGSIRTNFTTEKNEKGNKATAKIGSDPVVHITAQASSGGIKIEN